MPAVRRMLPAARLNNIDVRTTQNVINNVPFSIGQQVHILKPLPSSELTDPDDDVTLPKLIEELRKRHNVRLMMLEEDNKEADIIKSVLQQLQSKIFSFDGLIQEQNEKLSESEKNITSNQEAIECLEKQIKGQNEEIDSLQKMIEVYKEDVDSLLQELQERARQLQRELTDKRNLEQRLNSVVKDTQLKWERECEKRVNAVILEMQKKLWLKDAMLNQLKTIVMEEQTDSDHQGHEMQKQKPNPETEKSLLQRRLACSTPIPDSEVHADFTPHPDLSFNVEQCEIDSGLSCHFFTPNARSVLSATRNNSASEQEEAFVSSTEYHSCLSPGMDEPFTDHVLKKGRRARRWSDRKDEPICSILDENEKRKQRETPVRPLHRRFAGGKNCLNHTPSSSLDLGTVLQPNIPNAIKVCSPSEKDLSKCDRYVLTHQEIISDGEIRTKLIKGDVLKTRGGGLAVQFTDIETLKQKFTPYSM